MPRIREIGRKFHTPLPRITHKCTSALWYLEVGIVNVLENQTIGLGDGVSDGVQQTNDVGPTHQASQNLHFSLRREVETGSQ